MWFEWWGSSWCWSEVPYCTLTWSLLNELIPLYRRYVPDTWQIWLHDVRSMLFALQSSSIQWRLQYGRCHLEANRITMLGDSICSSQILGGSNKKPNPQIYDEITASLYKRLRQLVTANILFQHALGETLAISEPASFHYFISAYCEAWCFFFLLKNCEGFLSEHTSPQVGCAVTLYLVSA